jgi:proteasome component ECM29
MPETDPLHQTSRVRLSFLRFGCYSLANKCVCSVVLPVAALLEQFKAHPDSSLVRHYDLVFIRHSLDRLPLAERRQLVPTVLNGIACDEGLGQDAIFNLFLRLLPDIKLPPRASQEDALFRDEIGLSDPKDADFVAQRLCWLFLLAGTLEQSVKRGLEESQFKFLTLDKPDTWAKENQGLSLGETRRKAVKLLESGAFTDAERFLPALYASAQADSEVSSVGNDMMKRTSVSLEDEATVKEMFLAHSRLGPPYRVRILRLLSKSSFAATLGMSIWEVFELHHKSWTESRSEGDAGYPLWVIENAKALFQFLNWTVKVAPRTAMFARVARSIMEHLMNFLMVFQGFPKPEPTRDTADDRTLRCLAYDTIGALAQAFINPSPEMITKTDEHLCNFVLWLLHALASDPTPDAVVHIDGALSSISSVFRPVRESDVYKAFIEKLWDLMTTEPLSPFIRSIRHALVQLANRCYPFSNTYARLIDIVAVSRRDERSEVVEEGRRGLDPWTFFREDEGLESAPDALPDWRVLAQQTLDSTFIKKSDQSPITVMFRPNAIDFIKLMSFLKALPDFRTGPGWQQRLDVLVKTDMATRIKIQDSFLSHQLYDQPTLDLNGPLKSDEEYREELQKLLDHQQDIKDGKALPDDPDEKLHNKHLGKLLQHALDGMQNEDVTVAELCARSFLELASLTPARTMRAISKRFWDSPGRLDPLIASNRRQLQRLGAKVVGLLTATRPGDEQQGDQPGGLLTVVKDLKEATGDRLTLAEGLFLTRAYAQSRAVYLGRLKLKVPSEKKEESIRSSPSILEIRRPSLDIVLEALIQLWTACVPAFGMPADLTDPDDQEAYLMKHFIEPLSVQAKKGNEKAIMALGRVAMVTNDDNVVESVLVKLYELYEIKQAEVHFAVGEAIAAAVVCWDSTAVELTLDVDTTERSFRYEYRPFKLGEVLEKLLSDSKSTKPSLIKASGIWLFCMIQYSSHLPEVQTRLRECQVAFMRLLSARDELVQETASRGLALVYEKGDPLLKEALLRDFVASFTGSGSQIKVDDETELFDAGALPTGEGKSITSYKDIVSLANEVGDQTLVYRFMSLANNAATWATRSAFGRFGLSNILAETEVDPKLYPKLFRYRFDPNPNVQKSMDDIWKAMVKDPNAVLEKYFHEIMWDLIKSILGREWRVREASCAAIADLLQGRPFDRYLIYYTRIWAGALKVLDDVKASVRAAALNLCAALSNTLVRQLEESASSASTLAMMNEALPFLLSDKGIESTTEDVKVFATITVIKIAKSGGRTLKPYIASMVTHLLGLLSTIEPEQINYFYNRAGEDNREKIDKLRSQMVSRSPLSEAIENLLRHVDAGVMEQLGPKLYDMIKSAIGMPTKIGCGRVLGTLATRHGEILRPDSAKFLQLLKNQTLDRNDEVSSGYARAAAYVFRIAPEEAQEDFLGQVVDLYFNSENDTRRQKVADVVLALSKISPDYFSQWDGLLLPFAFVGKHDTDDYVHKAFEEVWSQHAGSSLTVMRRTDEIIPLVDRSLNTAQWALRHGGALASASLVLAVVGANTLNVSFTANNLSGAWYVLEKSLTLKTFPGKEKLLDALVAFVKHRKTWDQYSNHNYPALADKPRTIALREAKRNNETYRPHAFGCLWKVAAVMDDQDMLNEISGIVGPFIAGFLGDVEMKESADRAGQAAAARGEDMRSKTVWAAIEAIAKGYNRPKLQKDPFAELDRIIFAFEKHNPTPASEVPVLAKPQLEPIRRAYWYACVTEILEEASTSKEASSSSANGATTLEWLAATLDLDNTQAGTEQQRLGRAKAVMALLVLWRDRPMENKFRIAEVLVGLVGRASEEERSLEVKEKWNSCLRILDGKKDSDES